MKLLQNYNWPGNIRQLENIVERLVISHDDVVIPTDSVKRVLDLVDNKNETVFNYKKSEEYGKNNQDILKISLNDNLENIEKFIIQKMIEKNKTNKTLVAKKLGIGRSTLWRKINKT